MGTITPRKGHGLLVEALAGLREFGWRLRCVGSLDRDPDCVAALRAAIARTGLASRIELTGEMPAGRLAAAYHQADVFVLPSFHEGYGMAHAEALAHGLPVIATRTGALPDTVPESAGLLVAPGDVTALREALRRLIADRALRGELAAGAARAGAALPDWPQAIGRWIQAFDALCNARVSG